MEEKIKAKANNVSDNIIGAKPSPEKFTVADHNEIIDTLDKVILKINEYNIGNLELDNAIKDILSASSRVNKFYVETKQPKNEA